MTIFLLRHGHVEFEGQAPGSPRRFLGQTDAPLSLKGREQARVWQSELADKNLTGFYASDLVRCAETARIIAGRGAADIRYLPALREIDLGKLEGLSMEHVRTQLPGEWQKRGDDLLGYRPEGGESFDDLEKRVLPVFEDISRDHDGNILIVAHAGVNRVILCHVLGMPLSNLFRIGQSHGCLNILEPHKDFFRVTGLNRECPLP